MSPADLTSPLAAHAPHLSALEWVEARSGQVSQRVEQHLEACDSCRRQLRRLDQQAAALRALPEFEPPADLWEGIAERIEEDRGAERRNRARRWTAMAAVFLLLLTAGWIAWRTFEGHALRSAQEQELADQLTALREQSQLLDAQLRDLAELPAQLSGRQASAVVVLEDALAEIDRRIDSLESASREGAAAAMPAWQERVGLQLALIELRHDPVVAYEL